MRALRAFATAVWITGLVVLVLASIQAVRSIAQPIANQSLTNPPFVDRGTHRFSSGGVPPTQSGCGTGAVFGDGATDNVGDIITGTSPSSCVITFATTWGAKPPLCVVEGEAGPTSYSRTATTLTLSSVQASTRYTWNCVGRP